MFDDEDDDILNLAVWREKQLGETTGVPERPKNPPPPPPPNLPEIQFVGRSKNKPKQTRIKLNFD